MGIILDSEFEITAVLHNLREQNKKVVLCHGVFDLLHPGHLEHFAQAACLGDALFVSVTSDPYVNKGPGRPVFDLETRMLALSRIVGIDYVIASDSPNAIRNLEFIKPEFYIKGIEYKDSKKDITGMIERERKTVESFGGSLVFTEGFTSSSTRLINKFFSNFDSNTRDWLQKFKESYSLEQVGNYLEKVSHLKVGIVGEMILDKYTSCLPLAKSSKDPILAFHKQNSEEFPGGVLAIANNCATWTQGVFVFADCFTELGEIKGISDFLNSRIIIHSLKSESRPLITKHRFVEQGSNIRLFETYEFNPDPISEEEESEFSSLLRENLKELDLVIVADYGHGLLTRACIDAISETSKFISVNTQANAGNRGYNTIAKYPKANLICLNGSEMQLELRDKNPNYFEIVPRYISRMQSEFAILTLGGEGLVVFDNRGNFTKVPALASKIVDKVGAGDSVLAIGSLLAYLRAPIEIIGLLCSLVAAHEITQLGHRTSLSSADILKSVRGVLG